jgi:hypothetical protein
MHRVLVALLAAFDAALAVVVGVVVVLAPLTLLWVLGLGQSADWGALWPASATVWQFGHLVPLLVALPGEYLAATGIDPSAASFWLSLAPLAFTAFTAIFAVRSGARASRADAWFTGTVAGSVVFAALTVLIALSARNGIAAIHLWQAVLFPSLVFAVPMLAGAFVVEWREAGSGLIAHVRDRIEAAPRGWGEVTALAARGTAAVLVGLIGAGALAVAVALVLRGGEVIALFESGHMDVLGATVVTLAQLAYLPTLVVWGLSFVAGPGFALGTGTAVSAAGTQVGVLPGIPLLGVIPESVSPWLLLVALVPVALGAYAGWIVRSRLAAPAALDVAPPVEVTRAPASSTPWATAALEGLLAPAAVGSRDTHAADATGDAAGRWAAEPGDAEEEPIAARLVLAVAIAALSAAGAAVLAMLASGALGPGRLTEVGPAPGPLALAVGLEVLLGAGILLLSPRPHRAPRPDRTAREGRVSRDDRASWQAAPPADADAHAAEDPVPTALTFPVAAADPDATVTAPLVRLAPHEPGVAPRRPIELPPVD